MLRNRTQYSPSLIRPTDIINTEITLDKSSQKVVKPGIIKATKKGKFQIDEYYGPIKSCWDIGKIKLKSVDEFVFNKGDVIEDLLYLGEGHCLMRFKGQVFVSDTCLDDIDGLERISQTKSEWWFTVNKNKKELGWFRMDEKNDVFQLIDTIK